jgi:heme-degrading monooxygenase HmoA
MTAHQTGVEARPSSPDTFHHEAAAGRLSQHEMRAVVTRIETPDWMTFARCVIAFLVLRSHAKVIQGFIDVALLIRWPRTLIIVSFWENRQAVTSFNTLVLGHSRIATWTHQRGAEVWSAAMRVERTGYMSRSKTWCRDGIRQFRNS